MPAKFKPKSVRDEEKRPIVNNNIAFPPNKLLEDILKCGFDKLATAFENGGGGGSFSCQDVADCIDGNAAVQSALQDFIENGNFVLNGTWQFESTVTFNDEVNFNNGPVNFNDLKINGTNVDISLDADSSFTNNGPTTLNGNTFIENLEVNNIALGPSVDISGLLSTDAGNDLIIGSDGGIYINVGGGGFSCSDVADCIDNDNAVQAALDNRLIDAITNTASVQQAFEDWLIDGITNDTDIQNAFTAFIEGGNFHTTGEWIFDGNVTFNGTPDFTNGFTISGGDVVVNVATDSANQTYNGSDPTWVLPSTPLSSDALHITTDSGINLIRGVDYSISGNTITWILPPANGEGLYAWWLVSTGLVAPGSIYKKTYSWVAGAGDSSVTFLDVDIAADSIITGRTVTSGTQLGFREFDLSTPGQITINSTATETGTIDFTYAYVI